MKIPPSSAGRGAGAGEPRRETIPKGHVIKAGEHVRAALDQTDIDVTIQEGGILDVPQGVEKLKVRGEISGLKLPEEGLGQLKKFIPEKVGEKDLEVFLSILDACPNMEFLGELDFSVFEFRSEAEQYFHFPAMEKLVSWYAKSISGNLELDQLPPKAEGITECTIMSNDCIDAYIVMGQNVGKLQLVGQWKDSTVDLTHMEVGAGAERENAKLVLYCDVTVETNVIVALEEHRAAGETLNGLVLYRDPYAWEGALVWPELRYEEMPTVVNASVKSARKR